MKYYLIDASAFVYAVENEGKTKLDFFQEKAQGLAFLYFPQFCVTEVLNTYARLCFADKKVTPDIYTKWRGAFISAIHNRKLVYVYDLHRYHNLNADRIYKVEHTIPLGRNETPLSSFDILIIAMGMELKRTHIDDEVVILTRDARLLKIANRFVQSKWFE